MPMYIKRLETQISHALQDLEDAQARIDERQDEIQQLTFDKVVLETENAQLEENLQCYENSNRQLVEVLGKLQKELAQSRSEYLQLAENYKVAVSDLRNIPQWVVLFFSRG